MKTYPSNQIFLPIKAWLLLTMFLWLGSPAQAAPTYNLSQLLDLALQQNPTMSIAKAQVDAAQAGLVTAGAYLNPELEVGAGPSRYRSGDSRDARNNYGVGLSQPLEFPDVRAARRSVAESNIKVADSGANLLKVDLLSRVKSAFYNVVQRQAILKIAQEDTQLLKQIRERVKLRVNVGEAPKFELIKADTEALAAERDYQAALVRVNEAKALLRGLIGAAMPSEFNVAGDLPMQQRLPVLPQLLGQVNDSPYLQQIKNATDVAEAKLKLEESLRMPGLTLKAGVDTDPDVSMLRMGLAIPLPLWNQRQGQIAEASANVNQTRQILNERQLLLNRDVEAAYQRYLIAQGQLDAFDNGLLSQAEAALKVAESAYRFGERGILEYLDAQRVYRGVRRDYLSARYDYVSAMLEVERLLGTSLIATQ
jgi:cobalt-zinc-cadmium efflux system outer membrane protein